MIIGNHVDNIVIYDGLYDINPMYTAIYVINITLSIYTNGFDIYRNVSSLIKRIIYNTTTKVYNY